MSNEPLPRLAADHYDAVKQGKDAFFLYLHPPGQDVAEVERLAKKFIASAVFYRSDDAGLARQLGFSRLPALIAVQNGEVTAFKGSLGSAGEVETWVTDSRFPLFAELGSSNTDFFLSTDDLVVVLVADPAQSAFNMRNKPEVAKAAIQRHREFQQGLHKERVYFTWLDGNRWYGFASSSYGISASTELPLVVVTRPGSGVYYDRERGAAERVKIESKELLALIKHVEEGKVDGHSIGGWIRGIMFSIQKALAPVAVRGFLSFDFVGFLFF